MGTTIDAWIEYDEHGVRPFQQEPEVLPLDKWVGLSHAKDYAVYAAISGMRNDTGIPPLHALRGLPPAPSAPVESELGGEGSCTGWLLPSEVAAAIAHHGVDMRGVSLEFRFVLNSLEFLSRELGDERVRLVFYIE